MPAGQRAGRLTASRSICKGFSSCTCRVGTGWVAAQQSIRSTAAEHQAACGSAITIAHESGQGTSSQQQVSPSCTVAKQASKMQQQNGSTAERLWQLHVQT